MPYLAGFITPQDYGAVGDGTTDDTAAFNAALTATPYGGTVLVPPAIYATTNTITVPPQVTLQGQLGAHITAVNASIRPTAAFAGTSVISFVDQATGGYAVASEAQRVRYLTIDGTLAPGSSIDAFRATGFVHGVYLEEIGVETIPNHAVNALSNGSGNPYSWRMSRVHVHAAGGYAFNLANMTDTTLIDCESIAATNSGYLINGTGNSIFIGCRAEFSGFSGFDIQGGGDIQLIGCSTDRSTQHGVNIVSTGSTQKIIITGGRFTRDGGNGGAGGGTWAGINVNGATTPVVITGALVETGQQSGTGDAPTYGLSVTGATAVSVNSCALHGITSAINDGGGNTDFFVGANVLQQTGSTASPTVVEPVVRTTQTGIGVNKAPTHPIDATASTATVVGQFTTTSSGGGGNTQPVVGAIGADTSNRAFGAEVSGDANFRYAVFTDGTTQWGPGSAARDTTMQRAASGILATTKNFLVGASTALGDNGVGELQLANATTVPTTVPTGGLDLYSTAGVFKTQNPQGLFQTVGGLVQSQTSTVTVANTTSATALTSFTVPANDAVAGAVYTVTGYGVYSTTLAPTIQFILYWGGTGGTALATLPAVTLPTTITNSVFSYSAELVFRSTTSVTAVLALNIDTSITTDQVSAYQAAPSTATTVTTTGSNALTVGVTWSAASASNTISLLGGSVQRLA